MHLLGSGPDAADLNEVGMGLLELELYEEAIRIFDRILARDPKNLAALNNKGVALTELGRYHEALTVYEEAMALEQLSRIAS